MRAWPLVNLLRRRRFDILHRLLFGLGAFPQSDASFDEPALLRRPELLNQRVDAHLALIAIVGIGGQRDEAHSGHHVGRVSRRDARGCAEQNTGLDTLLSRRCRLAASANSPFSTPTVQK